jgi:hypothetical protein
VEVTFEGDVIFTEFHGFARGQPASGRILYDNTAAVSLEGGNFRTYPAVLSFDMRVGDTLYAMTGGPGELILVDDGLPTRYLVLRSDPGGVLGPPMAGFSPIALHFALLAASPDVIPSMALDELATAYGLEDFSSEIGQSIVGIQFQSGGDVVVGAAIALTSLDARPYLPALPLGRAIRLEDIVAGGDGSGSAPPENTGIDPRSGRFTTGYFEGHVIDTDGVTPQPVPDSPFIDSVFLLKGKVPTAQDGCNGCFVQHITQSGIFHWLNDIDETGSGFNYILKNRNGGVSTPGISVGPYAVGDGELFTTAIGLHASAGITFDLDALRERHGVEAVGCFSTYWGMDGCPGGLVRLDAILSHEPQAFTDYRVDELFSSGQARFISMPIAPEAKYLTVLCTSAGGNDNCDHGTLARPIISPGPCPQFSDAWIWRFVPSRVTPQGEAVIVEGEGLFDGYSIRAGGVDLLDQTFLSEHQRGGRTPALAPGFHDAHVIWEGLVLQHLPRAIEVAPPPVISAVSPAHVLVDRPVLCRFTGQNLRPDMEVLVPGLDGGEKLLHQEFHSPELITGHIPPEVLGTISGTDVVYLLDQGRLREFPVGQILYVEIGIEKVVPHLVPTAGGAVVTVEGLGFEPGMTFRVGSSPLLDLEIIDSAHARGKLPPLAAGLHAVSMVLGDGTVFHTVPDLVQAVPAPTPGITGILPLAVSTRGGDIVAITTDAWHGGATPRIGGRALTNVDATEIAVLRGESPPLDPGVHAVDLIGWDGAVLARVENAVEAVTPLDVTLTGVSPFEVAAGGGTPMTFTGTGFEPGLVPRLGGLPLTQVEVVDGTVLRGLSPPLEEGLHAAILTEGEAERARLSDAVHALPLLSADPVVGRAPAARVSAGSDRIEIAAAGIPAGAVLRVGGVPVTPVPPLGPCGVTGGEGGGGIAGGGGHAVFEGMVPDLPAGRYAVDFYLPGQGVVATLEDAVEVVASTAPPRASHVVSADVLRDGSTRLHIFGSGFATSTQFRLGGKPIAGVAVISPRLAVGHAPALGPGEPTGPRALELLDPRGQTSLESAVVYVDPDEPGGVAFVRGDANQSGRVDISDAVAILGYLFLGSPSGFDCLEAADIDGDEEVNISDPIGLLGFLFLGDMAPAAPHPDCGEGAAPPVHGCESFAPCGGVGGGKGSGGGPVGGLRSNVFVLSETRTSPGEPIIRDLSPVSGEVVVDDPPGGLDLQPGDIIAGYVPVTSNAIHEGVTYLVKLEGEQPGSCLATAPGDRTYLASPATLAETFEDAAIELEMPGAAVDMRVSAEAVTATGNTLCDLAEEAGGAGGDRGSGGAFDPLIDVDFRGLSVFSWQDGPNYIHAGFHRLRVLYATSEASLGIGISGTELTGVSFFSGLLLDTEMVPYIDSHFEQHIEKEKRILTLRKDHIVIVFGVPIHFAATGDLYAGVNLDARVNLYADAGVRAHFKAGAGFRFDGERIHNLSGIDPPSLERVPGTPNLDLSGSLVVKSYVRPETHLFAGILFRGLTADLGMRSEAFLRFHAEGETQPVPCLRWGLDAGMKLTLIPEIQLFGFDLFDRTFDVIDAEEVDLLSDEYGCKVSPVARVTYYLVPLGSGRYEVRLDASGSYDPDGGPLRYRWDFDADGQCDLASLGDPRATVVLEHVCPPFQVNPFDGCNAGRELILRVTDDEDVSVERRFRVVLR